MKRKVLGVVVALVLAVAGTVVLIAYVNGAEDRAVAGERTVPVLVVAQAIEQGTPAAALDGKVELKRVAAKVRAEGAVARLDALASLVATTDLVPGEQLITARFAKPSTLSQAGAAPDTSTLLRISVALEAERVVGGALRAGDQVAVFVSNDDLKLTHLVLHQVPVLSVQPIASSASSSGSSSASSKGSGSTKTEARDGEVMVSLAVTAPNAESLVWGAEHGTVWLAIEPRNADPNRTRVVTEQNSLQ